MQYILTIVKLYFSVVLLTHSRRKQEEEATTDCLLPRGMLKIFTGNLEKA